jgi:hypothetical protein
MARTRNSPHLLSDSIFEEVHGHALEEAIVTVDCKAISSPARRQAGSEPASKTASQKKAGRWLDHKARRVGALGARGCSYTHGKRNLHARASHSYSCVMLSRLKCQAISTHTNKTTIAAEQIVSTCSCAAKSQRHANELAVSMCATSRSSAGWMGGGGWCVPRCPTSRPALHFPSALRQQALPPTPRRHPPQTPGRPQM